MENKGLNAEQLNMIPHDVMVQMYLQQTEAYSTLLAQNNQLLAQNEELIRKVGSLEEKLAVMNQRMFGRKTERIAAMSDQLRLSDIDPALVLNEAEVLTEDGLPEEPGEETITYTRKKKKGKREEDLQYVDEVREVRHEIEEAKLAELFPYGYDRLPDEVYSDLEHIPERYLINKTSADVDAKEPYTAMTYADYRYLAKKTEAEVKAGEIRGLDLVFFSAVAFQCGLYDSLDESFDKIRLLLKRIRKLVPDYCNLGLEGTCFMYIWDERLAGKKPHELEDKQLLELIRDGIMCDMPEDEPEEMTESESMYMRMEAETWAPAMGWELSAPTTREQLN